MRKFLNFALLSALSVLVAGPSFAQAVAYSGKLQIGFGDQDNVTGFRSNNAIPICAGGGPVINPGTIGTTLGTLAMNGTASQVGSGPGSTISFQGVQGTGGGAQVRVNGTCNVAIPGFANPRLRSRTQVGAAQFPGRKGPFTTMITQVSPPATAPIYPLAAAGGNEQTASITNWTTMATGSAAPVTFTGAAYEGSIPFFGLGLGVHRVQPGAARFGGGMPFSGGGGVQLGVNFTTMTPGGAVLVPGDYGLVLYANGFLPTSPQIFGTDATGVNILNQITATLIPPTLTYTRGLVNGRQDNQYAARTPGGATKDDQGAIRTLGGGNTVTPAPAPGPPIISPVAFTGLFGEWTTGAVTHTDKVGDFTTIRKASGFDVAVNTSTAVGGETRRLQVVSPWAATIRPVGPFGLPVPALGFGGIASMTLNIIPAPEPGTLAMLGFGVLGLVGLSASRRSNG